MVNSLDYEYYEGAWTALPDFDALTPVRTGSINNFDISGWTSDTFAFRFTGYIEVPDDNIYTFYTTSDDGSKLLIADTLVVDNDGMHGMTERFGTIGLFAGKHALTVIMFDGGGNQALQVRYESLGYGGISKRLIPDSVLYH